MGMKKTLFGTIPGEGDVQLYTITNAQGASISVSTLGAGLVRLLMPDRNGVLGDCVLGYDFPDPYLDARNGYQGLVVGRFANRIAGGRFHIDGIEYNVPKNQDNCLCLHGAGRLSFHNWNEVQSTDNSLTLSFFSPDMEDGFPGNFTCTVRYILTAANTVRIEYRVESDRRTIANVTNHAYFNLACDERTIDDHLLTVHADYYTETDEHIVPTGNLKPLQDTPLDFT
ncbi:MAG: galactose-1-epimerase, partial [Clostridiales bacterium]|nr:galactose-1-epimerase [Clostridiales bacterium]